jgi:hypothetical protein
MIEKEKEIEIIQIKHKFVPIHYKKIGVKPTKD